MFKSMMKINEMFKIMNNSLIMLPTPINISIWWNFGSLLGLCLMLQIISGIMISMHYCANSSMAFNSLIHIIQDVNLGWFMRLIHMNGASFFFMCLFIHISRGIYYNSYNLTKPWIMGMLIFIMTMTTAFMGYVLPWGQMSFWGATVITNLISTTPYIGPQMTEWLWGGFSVNNPTLNRFFTIHFILPFLIIALVMIHLLLIHKTGSNNPLGTNSNMYMIMFHSYFSLKDILGFLLMMLMLMMMMFLTPFLLSDPENFILASPMNTPIHIQPEWYFLFAYTILRSIPNKLGGVLALLMSIFILMIMPIFSFNKTQSLKFYPINQILFWSFINIFIILTWLGSCPVESPFIETSQIMTIYYFMFFFMNPFFMKIWDMINF